MNTLRTSRLFRSLAATVCMAMILQIVTPSVVLALTSGPTQPEFQKFSPVGADNLVNLFTGDFNYSLPVIEIPGPNGFGYALSLSYNNATSVEEEASWVGLGWTLNPGAINRTKRGLPDDYKGETITSWNKSRKSYTITTKAELGVEAFSVADASAHTTKRYNSARGYQYIKGTNFGIFGIVSITFEDNNGKSNWGFTVSPGSILTKLANATVSGLCQALDMPTDVANSLTERASYYTSTLSSLYSYGSSSGGFGFAPVGDYVLSTSVSEYSGTTWKFGVGGQADFVPDVGVDGAVSGAYSTQTPNATRTDTAYGYLYAGDATPSADTIFRQDGGLAHDSPYQKRDRFLGVPFMTPDQYVAVGEGISGSFRLHHRKTGHITAPLRQSVTKFNAIEVDPKGGADAGVGFSTVNNKHILRTAPWKTAEDSLDQAALEFEESSAVGERAFFRFSGDMGGYIARAANDDVVNATVSTPTGEASGTADVHYGGKVYEEVNNGARPGRSGFIGYNTNRELEVLPPVGCNAGSSNNDVRLRAFAPDPKDSQLPNYNRIAQWVDRMSVPDGIGEFAITKENGTSYVYGLPVYARDETELQLGVENLTAAEMDGQLRAYRHVPLSSNHDDPSVVGEQRSAPYATQHLLTEIYSPDYLDRTHNGPSEDDIGGWVRFDYTRTAGAKSKKDSASDWFRWRDPYRGLRFEPNSFTDPGDDVGIVSYGRREVYYVESIETKTHIAFFDISHRKDGYPAVESEFTASSDNTATTTGDTTNQSLRKLDRIRLYSKDADGSVGDLLRTVHFEYEYELCAGLPNAESDGAGGTVGKLTLKRVFFEHDGVHNLRVRPYEFSYEYAAQTDFPQKIQDRYPDITSFADDWTDNPQSDQNPDYSPFYINRWGNYQYADLTNPDETRVSRFNQWVNQNPDPDLFDPAAWQLKSITLPSGAEILVQYEQKDYRFVQNRRAMVMVPLQGSSGNTFEVDLSEIGLTNAAEKTAFADHIRRQFITGGEMAYFRFLYALRGSTAELGKLNSDYITGWASVTDVSTDANGDITMTFGDSGEEPTTPRGVCLDWYRTNRQGIVAASGSALPHRREPAGNSEDEIREEVDALSDAHENYRVVKSVSCNDIDLENSYIRLPIPEDRAKLGGGIRVKRVLVLDQGIEQLTGEDAALYGTEYRYVTSDQKSSGVASNEPRSGREENALVQYLKKRRSQSWAEKIFSGRDSEQFEGPLGESFLPPPVVGHSRVVVESIHKGLSGSGFAVHEYYTSRDFPFDPSAGEEGTMPDPGTDFDFTSVDGPATFRNTNYHVFSSEEQTKAWKSQGFSFVMIDMHGKPKSVGKFGGSSDDATPPVIEATGYEYFRPGEDIPVMTGPSITDTSHVPLGMEMDLVPYTRETIDSTNMVQRSGDGGIMLWFPWVPYVSYMQKSSRYEQQLKYHVTTKITRYPAIQKRITSTKNGITNVAENIAFDPVSGKPALVRSYDAYHDLQPEGMQEPHEGTYWSVSLPAHRYHTGMSQMALNYRSEYGSHVPDSYYTIDKRTEDSLHYLTVNTTAAQTGQANPLTGLVRGDLIEVQQNGASDRHGVFHVGEIAGNRIELLPTSISRLNDATEREDVKVIVVRSGRTNQLMQSAGSFTTYGEPPIANIQQ